MGRFFHFSCRCFDRQVAVEADRHPDAKIHRPLCRGCKRPMRRAGRGLKHLRSKASVTTAALQSRPARSQRTAVLVADARAKKRADKLAQLRKLAAVSQDADVQEALQDAEDALEVEDPAFDEDDDAYEPPARSFNLVGRCSAAVYTHPAVVAGIDATHRKDTGWVQVAGVVGRGVALNALMGATIGGGPLPAWKHHLTKPHKTDRFNSSEWCHLIADSLGGASTAANLVAAGFNANTYMACIEILLQGRTDLDVQVVAKCGAAHSAEEIVYRIRHRRDHANVLKERIYARAPGFSKTDFDAVQRRVRTFIGKR